VACRHRVSMRPRLQALTLELIVHAIFGVSDVERAARLRAALVRMLDAAAAPARLLLVAAGPDRVERWGLLRSSLRPVDALIAAEINRARVDPRLSDREDILAALVRARDEDGRPVGDQEVRDQLLTLLIAGHETTASALAWALERLVRHPAAWQRMRDEIAVGEDAYVDAVIKETLRLRPVFPIIRRRLTQPAEIGGWALPAGVAVVPCI